jgi:hypothetical protein
LKNIRDCLPLKIAGVPEAEHALAEDTAVSVLHKFAEGVGWQAAGNLRDARGCRVYVNGRTGENEAGYLRRKAGCEHQREPAALLHPFRGGGVDAGDERYRSGFMGACGQVPDQEPAATAGNLPAPDAQGRRVSRLVVTELLAALAAWVAGSYLTALGWAVIIAVSIWPLYTRLRDRLGGSGLLAPLLATLLLAALLLIPVALALVEIGREGQVVVQGLSDAQAHGIPVPEWVQHLPVLGQHIEAWWQLHLSQQAGAAELLGSFDAQTLTTWFRTLGGEVLSRFVLAFVTFVALFGLLHHGDRVSDRLMMLVDRWLGAPGDQLAAKMVAAIRGTVNGTLLVALAEGVLIGLAYGWPVFRTQSSSVS